MFHGKYDVSEIKKHVSKYTDKEWMLETDRQQIAIHHRKTQFYKISYFEFEEYPDFLNYEPKLYKTANKVLADLVMPIVKDMEKVYNGKFGRIMLTKLFANQKITPHLDVMYDYFNIARRFHVPIITNDLVDFYVNKERKVMKEGECWEINNKKIHAVENNSNEDRVHLLFDIIPNEFLI